jgi:hypothetical protein
LAIPQVADYFATHKAGGTCDENHNATCPDGVAAQGSLRHLSAVTPSLHDSAQSRALSEILRSLLPATPGQAVQVRQVFAPLALRGSALLAVLVALPFCLPVPLIGLSTPFGLLAGFFGFRLALGLPPWLPQSWLDRSVPYETLRSLVTHGGNFAEKIERVLHPRLMFLAEGTSVRIVCGLLMVWMAALLSLPIPIPGTNILPALPIVLLGLGLMERDGVFILAGYLLAGLASVVFASLAGTFWVVVQQTLEHLPTFLHQVFNTFPGN